ncbi:MAG: hypothetical protein L0177_00700, partial [Chloroflexi bacterium]|nr:hypothetical protein [Chloroflexota bacterium]
AAMCIGFLDGVFQTHDLMSATLPDARQYCNPARMRIGQSMRILVSYLRDHPTDLHKPGAQLLLYAMFAAYPCSAK